MTVALIDHEFMVLEFRNQYVQYVLVSTKNTPVSCWHVARFPTHVRGPTDHHSLRAALRGCPAPLCVDCCHRLVFCSSGQAQNQNSLVYYTRTNKAHFEAYIHGRNLTHFQKLPGHQFPLGLPPSFASASS